MKLIYKLAHPARPAKTVSKALPLPERINQFVANEPATTGYALEIWEQSPATGMRLRSDLATTPIFPVDDPRNIAPLGHVYYLKSAGRFYLQWAGGLGASTPYYYGPFNGDPADVLGLPVTN